MFLERLHKAPSGVLVNGCVLVELLSDHLADFQAGRRDKFYVYLNPLPGIIHLFIGFRDILWIWRMNGHNALFHFIRSLCRYTLDINPNSDYNKNNPN